MVSTRIKRGWWHEYRCTPGITSPYGFFGRHPIRCANEDVIEAYRVLEAAHLALGYQPLAGAPTGTKRSCPKGIGGKTCQKNGYNCSLHNYCIAIDVEYSRNRYPKNLPRPITWAMIENHTAYTPEIVEGIEGILNMWGEPVFKWLGLTLGDTMHWEIDVRPERMAIDYTTVPVEVPTKPEIPTNGDEMQTLRKGDGMRSRDYGDRTHLNAWVSMLQAALRQKGYEDGNSNDAECGIDGAMWDGTVAAVKGFQASRNLAVDGVCGDSTWKELVK